MAKKTRCALTVKLLTYLCEHPGQAAIVGPYKDERKISSALTKFNSRKGRRHVALFSQRKVLVVDPVTAETEIMWEVRLKGAINV